MIDVHAHWVPRGLVQASRRGERWFGWQLIEDGSGRTYVTRGNITFPFNAVQAALDDPAARAASRREEDDVHFEALIIAAQLWSHELDSADAMRFSREVNEEVAEVQQAFPDQFLGMAVLPLQDMRGALGELEYATAQLGLTAVSIASNVRGLNLDDPSIMPVLDAVAELGVAMCVHPTLTDNAVHPRLGRHYFWNSIGSPFESSLAAMSIVYGGLIDRHPDVRIMFTQGGGWVHFGIGRLMLRYNQRPEARPMLDPPLDYLSQMYFDCLVHDDDALGLLMKRAGSDRIVLGTDYPAGGDIEGGAVKWIRAAPFISAEDKRRILWGNAIDFLELDASIAQNWSVVDDHVDTTSL